MQKLSTLILCFFVLLFAALDVANAQAPVILHDSEDFLYDIIDQPKPKMDFPKKLAVKAKQKEKICYKPKSSKPASLQKNYKPQMVSKKYVGKPTPRSISNVVAKSISPEASVATNIIKPKPIIKRKPIIVIDPGHGGKDRGTMGKLGTKEKDLVLRYSLALKKELDKTGRYKVILTRYDDRFIELKERVGLARKVGGDVLISIHADSHPNKNTRGFSIYTLSQKRKEAEAKELLTKSNREDVVRGANIRRESQDVKEAIIDLAQESTKEVSDDFARTVAKHLGRRIQALPKHNREGSLAVLTGSDIPSVLIELGYLSNIQEERTLRTEEHTRKIVTSITNAINEYFSKFNLVF